MKSKKSNTRSHKSHSLEARQSLLKPESPFLYTEAYKILRTNLNFVTGTKNGCKRIAVTSTLPDEGKSVLSINLAITLAENGARVLLIDGDLRNPSIHRYLRVKDAHSRGLSTVLSGGAELSDCVFFHPKYQFSFIVAGSVPPNPSELLGSEAMANALDVLSSNFDYIIFDTPPAGIVTDALVLSHYVEGTILVVQQGATRRNQVRAVKQGFDSVGATILGVVLNRCNLRDMDERYSYHGGYYHYDYVYGRGENR